VTALPRPPKAVLFGSIGALVETSEIQRRAFNAAFLEAGLAWTWDEATYADLLARSGGRARIEACAAERGETVDAAAIHRRKSEIFRAMIAEIGLPLRPGVAPVIVAARSAGLPLGFVTTTARANVEEILAHARPPVAEVFALVTTAEDVTAPKPAPEVYRTALARLGLAARDVVAIEDSPTSAEAALAAGLPCVVFPGDYHRSRDFPVAASVVERLTPEAVGLAGGKVRRAG